MRCLVLFVLAAALASAAGAQTAPVPGSCTLGRATADLDAGDVLARVMNTGSLFYGNGYFAAYSVPQREGKSPIYAANLWIGGRVGGDVRVVGGTYGAARLDYTLWPGPLGADARPVDPADCSAYDRIYTVSRDDIEQYYRTGVATPDLRDWPYRLGAPVLDGDGDPANYDLAGGDQPAITGAQMAWWLSNDVGGPRQGWHTQPLGVEVRAAASAFPTATVLGQTTLYRYTVTNRTQATIDSVYVGMYIDADLGDASDDFVGSDTTRSMVYFYNADNVDGTGAGATYGLNPPAVGLQVVSGPVGLPNGRDDDRDGQIDEPGERLPMTAAPLICKSGPVPSCDEPSLGSEIYTLLKGLLLDGTSFRAYGSGAGQTQGEPTRFAFPGDPVTRQPWNEINSGVKFSFGGDRRSAVSTGPFRLAPGASETVVLAIPFARGTDNIDSISRLRSLAGGLLGAYQSGALAPTRVERTGAGAPNVDQSVRLSLPAPNPFRDHATVRYQMPTGTAMRATLLDARGRRIAVLFDGPTQAPEGDLVIDGAGLAQGVYRVRVVVGAGERVLTLVRTR